MGMQKPTERGSVDTGKAPCVCIGFKRKTKFTVKYLDGFMTGIVLWGVEIDILVTSSILNTHISA